MALPTAGLCPQVSDSKSFSVENNGKDHFHFFSFKSSKILYLFSVPVSIFPASCPCGSFQVSPHQATKSSLGASMEYSALRLETLALHEVLKADLPTDQLGPVNQRELAAWKWFEGYYRVVAVQVRTQLSIFS